MDVDIAQTAAAVVPFVAATVVAYGTQTLEKLRDRASDATVALGQRFLGQLLTRDRPALTSAVEDLAADPADEDATAALRLQIRKALTDDPALAAEIAGMLAAQTIHIEASGERSVATHTNDGIISTGDGATFLR
ncbi:hypothetical protein OHA72_31780 [Dactylosporangium sp. NBC_01737]|uniref:hypothetical protein n=1 Tax=Dactylosporangium sp. NBC_01737 TaxID=2975959 RepID=UPI002E0F7AA8|nr:hypothetical protein OHA72_31780 [Dactylosporangium sp. NBC_01737]